MSERWQELEDLYLRLRGVPPADRETALGTTAARNPALAAEVRSLLEAEARAEGFLSSPPDLGGLAQEAPGLEGGGVGAAPGKPPPRGAPPELSPGDGLGPYRVLGELGRGGMSTVYLGERADGAYQQQVAVKVIHGGAPNAADRFLAERQILASLDHPNIARLLDGGATGAGDPYLVLELVQGEPIDEFCDHRRWPLRPELLVSAGRTSCQLRPRERHHVSGRL